MEQSAEFWQDNVKAAQVQKKKSQIEGLLKKYAGALEPLDEAEVYLELAREEEEPEYESEIVGYLDQAFALLEDLEVAVVLSGANDNKPAFVTINAGAGGTESQDWADMLLRMYLRYCDNQGWKADIMDLTPGDEAGIKGATIAVEGDYAYGYLKAEIGIHRLVRISPFDAAARRHTSFASVFAFPQVDDSITIDIDEKDLRLDVYRASGAGGQKVNKTSSAVRITHIPSGIVVQCQNERSQLRNKEVAFKVLRSRLMELERDKQDAEKKVTESTKMRIDFGSQIRSYVLAPYRLVKDHRTKHEMGNANAVLDGDIHGFIKAFLLSGQEMEAGKPRG
jgi:peptide chain release factor 2